MNEVTHTRVIQNHAAFIRSVVDLLRGDYKLRVRQGDPAAPALASEVPGRATSPTRALAAH